MKDRHLKFANPEDFSRKLSDEELRMLQHGYITPELLKELKEPDPGIIAQIEQYADQLTYSRMTPEVYQEVLDTMKERREEKEYGEKQRIAYEQKQIRESFNAFMIKKDQCFLCNKEDVEGKIKED